MTDVLEKLVASCRMALDESNASVALQHVLSDSLQNPELVSRAIASMAEDEVLLYEDDQCSIWSCRYDSEVVFAPHEHCMMAHVAVYQGAEVEVMYQCIQDRLCHIENKVVRAGELVSLAADAVHAVTAEGEVQSHAIHVYEGPLTKVSRSLFDWESGNRVEFTMENFHALQRRKSQMKEFR